jgi:pilus assembly protein FimV
MDRKFVIALSSLAGSIMLSDAHAIGLGEIRLRSALNEPLRADIKLVQVNDLSENEIIVGLAPKQDFDRARVDRDFLLNSLRFRLDLDDPKNPKVVVTTQQPLREPFLNFLVEVQWPSGRLLREYTLLMDLPAFTNVKGVGDIQETKVPKGRALPADEGVSEVEAKPKPVKAPAPRVSTPKAQVSPAPAHEPEPVAVESRKAAPAPEKESSAEQGNLSSAGNTYGPTSSNDTMWRIAQGVQGAGSVQQKILAIQRLNPGAFSNGNVNLLKKGKVLKLPSQEEIASIGRADAIAQFNEQTDAWKTGNKPAQAVGAPLDATGRAQAPAPAASADGQLKLATPAASVSSGQAAQGAGGPAAEVAALQNDLSVGMEELNRAQRENQEIASRAKDLDAQKENAERLLQLQSSEMAAMQAKLAAEQQAKAAADAQAAADVQAKTAADAAAQVAADAQAKAAADAAAQAQVPVATTESVPAETPAEAPAPVETAAEAPAPAADTTAAPVEEAPAAPVETAAAPEAAVETPAPVEPAPQPEAEQTSEPSIVSSLISNPLITGIVAVVVIFLGLIGIRRRANRASEEVEEEFEESTVDYAAPQHEEVESYSDKAAEEEPEADWETSAVESAAEAEQPAESLQPETGDVLGEADIYISFGNFEKGESLLKSAIKAEPSRSDYRLKLLELHKESGNLSAFDEAYKDLIELDDDVAIAKAGELRGSISGASDTPFAFGVSSAAAAAGISDEVDFDLDLDMDFDAPLETPVETKSEVAPVAEPVAEAAEFFDVDFDLDSEPEFEPNQTSIREALVVDAEESPAEEEFSLDFDLDLEPPAVEVEPEPEVVQEPVVEQEQYTEQESAMLGAVTADAGDLDEELGFLSDADEAATKLDLARAYIDMGDKDGARDILAEVLEEGRSEQKREAQTLLDSIG